MKNLRFLPIFLIVFFLLVAPLSAHTETESTKLVNHFYAALVETMKKGPELGFIGRYKKLDPIITESFNLKLMARYAVGPTWGKIPTQQQEDLIQAFSNFSKATYASRFTKFDDEEFKVIGEKEIFGNGIMVETTLTPKNEEPIALNYLLRKDENDILRITDVYLDASISELATRRAEFASVIKHDGIDKLIVSLKKKAEDMGLVLVQ